MKATKKKSDSTQRAVCEQIKELSGGCLEAVHQPGDYFANDPDSKGHLYSAWLNPHLDFDLVDVDDREDIGEQLVRQCEAIGSYYGDLSRMIEARLDLLNPGRVRLHKKVVAVV